MPVNKKGVSKNQGDRKGAPLPYTVAQPAQARGRVW